MTSVASTPRSPRHCRLKPRNVARRRVNIWVGGENKHGTLSYCDTSLVHCYSERSGVSWRAVSNSNRIRASVVYIQQRVIARHEHLHRLSQRFRSRRRQHRSQLPFGPDVYAGCDATFERYLDRSDSHQMVVSTHGAFGEQRIQPSGKLHGNGREQHRRCERRYPRYGCDQFWNLDMEF